MKSWVAAGTPGGAAESEIGNTHINMVIKVVIGRSPCFPWHEVRKVEHYWLEVDALTKLMQVGEALPPYGKDP